MASRKKKSERLTNLLLYDPPSHCFIINKEPVQINEGKVISASLVGHNIIFSLKGQMIFKLSEDKKYTKIYQGESDPNSQEYTQIQTDFSDPDIFYSYLNSKIFEFRIEDDVATRRSKLDISGDFDIFVISSKYVATQKLIIKNQEIDVDEEEDEDKIGYEVSVYARNNLQKLYQFVTELSCNIYIDNTFFYIHDESTKDLSIYPLDFTSEQPYTIINSVVGIIKGDRIGYITSNNKMQFLGCKTKPFDPDNTIYCYINKNVLYKVGPDITSQFSCSKINGKENQFRLETNVYFDNTNNFIFKRSFKNESICSKSIPRLNISNNEDKHFLSQIMLQQDYYLVSANNSIILYKNVAETSELKEKVLLNEMKSPIASLVSDLQESFSFFGLTNDGSLDHYKIDMSNVKLEVENIATGIIDFCASFNYIVYVTFYNTIHIINRSNNDYDHNGLPREMVEKKNFRYIKIVNDDEFVYILYKGESNSICYKYSIDHLDEEPVLIDDIYLFWRTSNNGSICIQNKESKLITCGKYTYSLDSLAKGVAFSKGSFCIWKEDDIQNPEILTLYSDSLVTTFYNGFCCFFYNPNQDTFGFKYNDDRAYYSKQINNKNIKNQAIRGTIDNFLSATVIGLNTIVFSTKNGLILFFVSLNEHCYSINIDIPQVLLTNLMPHPNDMYSFFGLSQSDLYLFTYDQVNIKIKGKKIARDVLSYSVSRNHILIQFKDDSETIAELREMDSDDRTSVFIYELEKATNSTLDLKVFSYCYSFEEDFPHVDKNLISYFIDDDFVYIFKHQNICNFYDSARGISTECKLYKLDENNSARSGKKRLTKSKKTYENVLNVFDSFQVTIVLSNNKFVFKNKIYDYQPDTKNEKVQTLFAACQDEIMVWNTYFDDFFGFNFNDPIIYKQPTALKPIINCWYDGEESLLFKRGEFGFLVNDEIIDIESLSFLIPRFLLKLNNNRFLIISNDQFIVYRNKDNKDIKDVGILASADSYRSDPSDLNRFFAYFKLDKQLYIVQFVKSRDFYHRIYCNDVVKYDVSKKYFVFIDSKGIVHCMKRDGGLPRSFDSEKVDVYINDQLGNDASHLIPFIDDWFVYFFDPLQLIIRRFAISDEISEINPIENVISIWSTDGVVIQTYEEDQYYIYIKDIQLESKSNEKIFAAALYNDKICVWVKENDEDESFYDDITSYSVELNKICDIPDIQETLKDKLANYKQQIKDIIEPIQTDIHEKREFINKRFEKAEQNLDEITKSLQNEHDNKFNVKNLNEMNEEDFVNFVKQKDFISKNLKFSKVPPMYLLILIRKIINYINQNDNEFKQEIDFWIQLLYRALSILPIDPITKTASKPFLDGFKNKIVDIIDFVESSELENEMKKRLSKSLMNIDVILSSFFKK